MKTSAIICEYNPFHKGHLLQLNSIKEQNGYAVCIMSGGYVQRGQPALFDKYVRAKAAVEMGADLVLELPYPYSCSAAEFFCRAGVAIADKLGIVDELYFGSECGDIDTLTGISKRLSDSEFTEEIKKRRESGQSRETPYAELRSEVYRDMYGQELTKLPNDTLGIGYVSALRELNSTITPVTYKREHGYSATESRRLIIREKSFGMIPDRAAEIFEGEDTYSLSNIDTAILSFYRTADPESLKKFEGMTNGIAERLVKSALSSSELDELLENMSGKSYTNAKIRRCILHGMTGVTTDMLREPPCFTNVLAAGENGRALIKRIEKQGRITLLTKPSHYKKCEGNARTQAEFNVRAEALLTLMCDSPKEASYFLKQTPYIKNAQKLKEI